MTGDKPVPEPWTFPPEKDGWFLAHNAIRNDMACWAAALEAFSAQLAAGTALEAAQIKAIGRAWDAFAHFLHDHHDNEETYVMQALQSKNITPPPQMTGDHKALMDALGEVGLHVTAMCTSADTGESRKAAQAALAALTTMRAPCEEHFALEENEVYVGIFRQQFTQKEYTKLVGQPIAAASGSGDYGFVFSGMSKEEFKEFTVQEKVPAIGQLVIRLYIWLFKRKVQAPFQGAVARAQALSATAPAATPA